MTLSSRPILPSVVLLLLLASGCLKKESYPDTPAIELKGFTLMFDSAQFAKRGILSISYTDGNGDIGLSEGDTLPPYSRDSLCYYNLVINYYEKQNGTFHLVVLNPPFSGRLPLLSPDYPGKAIKGIITDTLLMNPAPVFDTVKFEVFLYDHALNKSNTVTTPEIILRRP